VVALLIRESVGGQSLREGQEAFSRDQPLQPVDNSHSKIVLPTPAPYKRPFTSGPILGFNGKSWEYCRSFVRSLPFFGPTAYAISTAWIKWTIVARWRHQRPPYLPRSQPEGKSALQICPLPTPPS
jgi:hypothetical protein